MSDDESLLGALSLVGLLSCCWIGLGAVAGRQSPAIRAHPDYLAPNSRRWRP
jgi:hypothetical protein